MAPLVTYWVPKLRFVDGLAVQCILLPEFVYDVSGVFTQKQKKISDVGG